METTVISQELTMHKYNVENDACVVKDLTMQKDSQNVKKAVNHRTRSD